MVDKLRQIALTVGLALSHSVARAELTIDNFQVGDSVRYPVVILRGHASGSEMAIGRSWKTAIRFPVIKGHYTAQVQLEPGSNMLLLHAGNDTVKFRLDYHPSTSVLRVVPILILPKDAPLSSIQRACTQIGTGFRLCQAITADAMVRAGNSRRTFFSEADSKGDIRVRQIDSGKTEAELSRLSGEAMANLADQLVKQQLAQDAEVSVCFCPSWQEDLVISSDTTVLGGGLFSRLPLSLKETPKLLLDFDPASTGFGSPSSTHGLLTAATLSGLERAILRQFGLRESSDLNSLTIKGKSAIHRCLIATDPVPGYRSGKGSFSEDNIPGLTGFDSALLSYSGWLMPDATRDLVGDASKMPSEHREGDSIVVEAANGIRVLGLDSVDSPTWFSEFRGPDPLKKLVLSIKELEVKLSKGKGPFQLRVVDDHGLQATLDISGPFQ